MTKREWIELVQKATGIKYQDRTIAMNIEQAQNTVLGQVFLKDPSQWDLFARPYEATVVHGTWPYALLPQRIIQIGTKANGVRRIYPAGSGDLVFMPMPAGGHQLYREVGLDQTDTTIGFDVRHDRVWFYNMRSPIVNILMDLVVPFSRWDDDWDYPVPIGTAEVITDMAVARTLGVSMEKNIYKKAK